MVILGDGNGFQKCFMGSNSMSTVPPSNTRPIYTINTAVAGTPRDAFQNRLSPKECTHKSNWWTSEDLVQIVSYTHRLASALSPCVVEKISSSRGYAHATIYLALFYASTCSVLYGVRHDRDKQDNFLQNKVPNSVGRT